MKKLVGVTFLVLFSYLSFAQNKDTSVVNLTNFRLQPGTFSWRGNNTFHNMTSWNSGQYTEGHLRQGNNFRMNYRLLLPVGHNPSYQPGYPLIVMLHGAGERGNCWNDNCYCAGTGCNPNDPPIQGTDARFLNNDHSLTHGGSPHLAAVNLAGNRLPNDPALNSRAFPGFVLFPQMLNQWRNSNNPSSSDLSYALRIIRLLCRQYNIDPDRVYIHGLSMGGQAVLEALNFADWMFAAAAPMSAISFQNSLEYDSVANIPMWFFQGGKDTNPRPSQTETMIRQLREKGATVRYTLYDNLGHGTWNAAYAEPDFFSWLLSHNKSNIHVAYNNPNICGTTGAGAELSLPQGFLAYQWERDGQIIAGATSNTYIATIPGVYRARFSRLSSTPGAQQWNRWSNPVTVGEQSPAAPLIEQEGTIVLRDLNNNLYAQLNGPADFVTYTWYKDGVQVPTNRIITLTPPNKFQINGCGTPGPCEHNGAYTLVTQGFDKCPSLPSKPKYIVWGTNNTAIVPPAITGTPSNFTAVATSPTQVLLQWQDNSRDERHFEIWRRKLLGVQGENFNSGWVMAALTGEDETLFLDSGLDPASTYWYKIRAVNNIGRSNYFPNNSQSNVNHNRVVNTLGENIRPTPPSNLVANTVGVGRIELTWDASTDASGIRQYYVYYNSDSVATNSRATTFTISNLPINNNYIFTVKAQDNGGNLSLPSNPSSAHTVVTGLYYKHSTGAWQNFNDATMAPTWTSPEFTGWVPNFTLQPRTQEDFFNFEFDGYIYIQTAGAYTFFINSDDGSRLFINDVMVIDFNGTHGLCGSTGTTGNCPNGWGRPSAAINLAAGAHKIRVRYFEYTGGQNLLVRYRGPDTNNNGILIPDAALRSGNVPAVSTPPPAPTNLVATAASMNQINLTWNYGSPMRPFEVHRSLNANGPFLTITRTSNTNYGDLGLTPNTTYFYRVRAVGTDTTSAFTAVASATTSMDSQPPTQPTDLAMVRKSFSTVSLIWNASTDNNVVAGYEIFANNVLIGTSAGTGFQASNLLPGTQYQFYVVAYDQNNNRSVPSSTLAVTTDLDRAFFSRAAASDLSVLASWQDNQGASPTSFAHNGQTFYVQHTRPVNQAWRVEGTVSKVIVGDGITLNINSAPIEAKIEVPGNGTVNLVNSSIPDLAYLSPSSTVNYFSRFIQQNTYGNLNLFATGANNFTSGITTVSGNLTVANGISIKGASGNATTLRLGGDLSFNGTPDVLASSFGVTLELTKIGEQVISSGGPVDFFEIRKVSNGDVYFVSIGPATNINVGSTLGGGISLGSSASLSIGNNTLNVIGGGTINDGASETGRLGVSGGSINLTTNSNQNSKLFFKPSENTVDNFTVNLTGSGSANFNTGVNIANGLKIRRGDVHSNGHITLLSTATKTANLEEIENGGRVLGNITVQRYMAPKGRIYRYLSSPVSGTKIADWQTFFPITGPFAGASTGSGLGTGSSVFVYKNGWIGYPGSNSSNQAPLERGRGYSALIRNTSTPINIITSGVPYQGTIPFVLKDTAVYNAQSGWNLLGNPYASTIVWSLNSAAWPNRSNLSSIVAVTNNNGNTIQYQYYDAATGLGLNTGGLLTGGRIAPGQAFWVQVIGPNPSLSITERAKVSAQQTLFREAETNRPNHIKLTLTKGQVTDDAIISFTDYGSDLFDAEFDGIKRPNAGIFNLSSRTIEAPGVDLAFNNMSESFCSKTIKLNVNNVSAGTHSLILEDVESLRGASEILLKDAFLDITVNLKSQPVYTFDVTNAPASFGNDRFEVVVNRTSLDLSLQATSTDLICGTSASINLATTQPGVYYQILNGNNESLFPAIMATGEALSWEIPNETLAMGQNEFKISASFTGCTSGLLDTQVRITKAVAPSLDINDTQSVCYGEPASLSVIDAKSTLSYKWFTENGSIIRGVSGSTLITLPILKETYFSVAAVLENGCIGPKKTFTVYPENTNIPLIDATSDTLYASIAEGLQWYKNGVPMQNMHQQKIAPIEPGIYSVAHRVGGCLLFSEEINFGITSTDTDKLPFGFAVYPNPTTAKELKVIITSASPSPVNVRVMDLVGRIHHSQEIGAQEFNRAVQLQTPSSMTSGVYFVILDQGGVLSKTKIIFRE